jgi:hypothetical protein
MALGQHQGSFRAGGEKAWRFVIDGRSHSEFVLISLRVLTGLSIKGGDAGPAIRAPAPVARGSEFMKMITSPAADFAKQGPCGYFGNHRFIRASARSRCHFPLG